MKKATIEELAYLLKQAKKEGLPQPIVFLGAGASKTGGVPLATEIIDDILTKYKKSPKIQSLKNTKYSYAALMECLTPFERNKLLKEYIDRAKINVTHIYLAQLLIEDYVDFILTVNFDNLMLRALALFNYFPATYDMAILKDLTTTSFNKKSIVFLHGQHHGLWLLNTSEEMAKVKEIIPPILNGIKNQRPWIFIGYSGEDPIFEHIIKLGRFDNGLYWVGYNDNTPSSIVCKDLLDKTNTNSFIINGYDSDSFMIKLNSELGLPQPIIVDKPFTSLQKTLENIVDIDDIDHFKGVKERLEISKRDVETAIQQFEEGKFNTNKKILSSINQNIVKKKIIETLLTDKTKDEEIASLEESTKDTKDKNVENLMAQVYSKSATEKIQVAKSSNNVEEFKRGFELYQKAIELDPNLSEIYYDWGTALYDCAEINHEEEFYLESIDKLTKSMELGGKSYNLACLYALRGDKKNALRVLEYSLKTGEADPAYVVKDDLDWKDFVTDEEFIDLLKNYWHEA